MPAFLAGDAVHPAAGTGTATVLLQPLRDSAGPGPPDPSMHQCAASHTASEAAEVPAAVADCSADGHGMPGPTGAAASRVGSCGNGASAAEAALLTCSPAAVREALPDPASSPTAGVLVSGPAAAGYPRHSPLALLDLEPVAEGDWQA